MKNDATGQATAFRPGTLSNLYLDITVVLVKMCPHYDTYWIDNLRNEITINYEQDIFSRIRGPGYINFDQNPKHILTLTWVILILITENPFLIISFLCRETTGHTHSRHRRSIRHFFGQKPCASWDVRLNPSGTQYDGTFLICIQQHTASRWLQMS